MAVMGGREEGKEGGCACLGEVPRQGLTGSESGAAGTWLCPRWAG